MWSSHSDRTSRVEPRRVVLRARAGFTIVETIVALLLMAVGLLALAGSGALVVREVGAVADRTRGGLLARNRVELFVLGACEGARTGTDTLHAVRGYWMVRDDGALATLTDSVVMSGPQHLHTVSVTAARTC